jgi:glycosyltransferase involved in cell wall biosynthesis
MSLVSIGIPTYNRPELLKRAVKSAVDQDYGSVEVLVSDNASPDPKVRCFLAEIEDQYPMVRTFYQEKNLGPVNNFLFLLRKAKGEYFMWLADDDELTDNYVSSLERVLRENPDAVTAMGHWLRIQQDGSQVEMEMDRSIFSDKQAWLRLVKYCWKSKDAFYYGLHRTDALRKATFSRFWWPNREVVINRAYMYLVDLVAQGRILLTPDESARWINHNYSDKLYHRELGGGIGVLAFAVRRLNIYVCYFAKALKWGHISAAAALVLVGPVAWARDVRKPFAALIAAIPRKVFSYGSN